MATVVGAYRREIDRYFADPDNYMFNPDELTELCKVSHRPYTTGFYYHKPDENSQVYTTSSYIRDYDLVGIVEEYDEVNKIAKITQRNRFFRGDEIEIIQPYEPYFAQNITYMKNADDEDIDVAPHAEMTVYINCDKPVQKGAMLRRERPEEGR